MDGQPHKGVSFKRIRESGKFKDFLVFLIFLCVAAFFWLLVTIDYTSRSDFKDTVRGIFSSEQGDTLPEASAADDVSLSEP